MDSVTLGTEHGDKISFERVWLRQAIFRDALDLMSPPVQEGFRLDSLSVTLTVAVKVPEGGLSAFVLLKCEVQPPDTGRQFAELIVAVEGMYSVSDSSGIKRLEDFARSQAPVLLFPYVRQAMTSLTVGSRLGGLILPPVNMHQVVTAMREDPEVAHQE